MTSGFAENMVRQAQDTAIRELQDQALMVTYDQAQQLVTLLRREIEARMIERNAVAIPDDTYLCQMPKKFTYFPQKFDPLKEVLSSQELGECWSTAWEETVPEHIVPHPETWNTNKLLAVARRHGDEAMKIVENARNEGRGSLTFHRK